MKTLEQLSHDTFYSMEKYSQLVIDFVQEVEDLSTSNSDEESLGSLLYSIDNVLEVIDKNRLYDVEALESLSNILRSELNNK